MKKITMSMFFFFFFCFQGLLYAGNDTIYESTGIYTKVICILVICIIHYTHRDLHSGYI